MAALRTWASSRGNRMPLASYPPGTPVHVVIGAHRRDPAFADQQLATAIFALMASHPVTIAGCLMPNHLHWILSDASRLVSIVACFKSYSTGVARRLGAGPKLWQRSFWDHVMRADEDLSRVALYVVQNPVRAGLVEDYRDWPFQVLDL